LNFKFFFSINIDNYIIVHLHVREFENLS